MNDNDKKYEEWFYGNCENIQIIQQKENRWWYSLDKDCHFRHYVTSPPNWFHRVMQLVFLGIISRKINN